MPARVNSNKRKSPDAAEDEDVVIVNHPAADDDRSAQDNDDVSILNRPADAAAGPVPKKQRRKGGLLEKMFFQYCDIREFH